MSFNTMGCGEFIAFVNDYADSKKNPYYSDLESDSSVKENPLTFINPSEENGWTNLDEVGLLIREGIVGDLYYVTSKLGITYLILLNQILNNVVPSVFPVASAERTVWKVKYITWTGGGADEVRCYSYTGTEPLNTGKTITASIFDTFDVWKVGREREPQWVTSIDELLRDKKLASSLNYSRGWGINE